jgi:hypothetical protein
MALPAKQDTQFETLTGSSVPAPAPPPTQMPINPTEREWRKRRGLRSYANRAADLLHTTKQSAGRMYHRARTRAADGYSRLSQRTGELTRQTRSAARYAQHEYPVRVLGVIAGTAFVAGVAIRIWRSRPS